MNSDQVRKAAKTAASLVEGVPSEFREAAFQVLFAELLPETEKPGQSRPRKFAAKGGEGILEEILARPIDYSRFKTVIDEGDWTERAVVVLGMLEDEFGKPVSLTPPQLSAIFEQQLRLAFVHRQNVYRELSSNRGYFIKTIATSGKGHQYSLSIAGKQKFEQLSGEEKGKE